MKQISHFPELHFSKSFSFKKAQKYVETKISDEFMLKYLLPCRCFLLYSAPTSINKPDTLFSAQLLSIKHIYHREASYCNHLLIHSNTFLNFLELGMVPRFFAEALWSVITIWLFFVNFVVSLFSILCYKYLPSCSLRGK